MIYFKNMDVVGFGPIQDASFDWGIKGLNIIKGPNGNGKSKFINALVWALYGKTLSGSVETWDLYKPKNYKGTMVSIEFTKGPTEYKVIRCKEYKGDIHGAKGKNRLIIEEDGEVSEGDKRDAAKDLESIIGYSFELFKNSIIFGQKLKRLVSETGPNKKKLLDEAFNVMFISKASELASVKLKVISENVNKISLEKSTIEGRLENLNLSLEREKEITENFEKDRLEQINNLKNYITNYDNDIVEVQDKIQALKASESNVEELTKTLKKYSDRRERVFSKITKIEVKKAKLKSLEKEALLYNQETISLEAELENLPKTCSNCGKPFTKDELLEERGRIKKRLKKARENYTIITDKISITKRAIREADSYASSLKSIVNTIDNTTKEINLLERNKKQRRDLKESIKTIESRKASILSKIEEVRAKVLEDRTVSLKRFISEDKTRLKEVESRLSQVQTEYDDYRWLITDPLSNSGLKAFIFNKFLGHINKRLQYYTKFSKLKVNFIIDMDSARKDMDTLIYNAKGGFVPYEDLSGGQQQKVDIVTVFAIHDVMSETKDCSLLVMDELFESLDSDNIELLTELIQDKAKNKCLYLITHRYEFSPTNSNSIYIDYEDGVTSIQE